MNSLRRLPSVVCLLLSAVCFAGCISTQTAQTFGPLVAEIAQSRIAQRILDRNPAAEPKLLAVADALDAITAAAEGSDITEAAVRRFVDSRSDQWGLTLVERELLTVGLVATLDRFLSATDQVTARLGDPKVTVWLDAVKRGIRDGVEKHRADQAAE